MIRTVHATMQPDRPIEVDDGEYLDLFRQGLLLAQAAPEPGPDAPRSHQVAAAPPPAPPPAAFAAPVVQPQPDNNQENPA